jgi:hypothetical protein
MGVNVDPARVDIAGRERRVGRGSPSVRGRPVDGPAPKSSWRPPGSFPLTGAAARLVGPRRGMLDPRGGRPIGGRGGDGSSLANADVPRSRAE